MGFISTNAWKGRQRSKALVSAMVFFVLPFAAMAQDNKQALVQELYGKSGMEKQVGQLPMIMQLGFDQSVAADNHLKVLPRNIIGEIRSSIEKVFASENIKKTILTECMEKLSIDDLKGVLEWLSSPLGRELTLLEESASTPEKFIEMQQFASQLEKSPPLPERLKIIRQLDSAMKATETSVEIALNTQLAVSAGLVASLPLEQQPSYDKLVAAIEQNRPQVENALRIQTIVSLLFTYDKISDEQLKEYALFASSPAGLNYHNVTISGLKKALLEGGYKWGELITDILKQSPGRIDA